MCKRHYLKIFLEIKSFYIPWNALVSLVSTFDSCYHGSSSHENCVVSNDFFWAKTLLYGLRLVRSEIG